MDVYAIKKYDTVINKRLANIKYMLLFSRGK